MNAQKDQIQALIAEIDEVLSQPSPRLPWVVFGENVTRSRQLLERVRTYLASLEEQIDTLLLPLPPEPTLEGDRQRRLGREALWQAIQREIHQLRENLTQPLQVEMESLRQERQALLQEIQHLEQQRQNLTSFQQQTDQKQLLTGFLQELMTHLQESLGASVTETLTHLETRFLNTVFLTDSSELSPIELEGSVNPIGALPEGSRSRQGDLTLLPQLTPAQRLERMRQLQAESDHLLMTLDSSLNVIFQALQNNLQTYHESLSQSIEKMHGLGKQGEAMFAAWVNHLAQQLGRETSSYLQSSVGLTPPQPEIAPPTADFHPPSETEGLEEPAPPPVSEPLPPAPPKAEEELLPYAGAELPRPRVQEPESLEVLADLFPEETEPEAELLQQPQESASEDSDVSELDQLFDFSEPSTTAEPEISNLEEEWEAPTVEQNLESVSELTLNRAGLFDDEVAETSTPPQEEEETDEDLMLDTQDLFDQLPSESPNWVDPSELVPSAPVSASVAEVHTPLHLDEAELFSESPQPQSFSEDESVQGIEDEATEDETTLGDLSDIFGEPTLNEVTPAVLRQPQIPTQPAQASMPPAAPPQPKVRAARENVLMDEDYIQASPHENLLPGDDLFSEEIDSHLQVDRSTLQQLETDLFNLEQSDGSFLNWASSEFEVGRESTEGQRPTSRRSQAEPEPPQPSKTDSEDRMTFEDLFRELEADSPTSALTPQPLNSPQPRKKENLVDQKALSEMSLSDVWDSFEVGKDATTEDEPETDLDSLSLEALSEIWVDPKSNGNVATKPRNRD